MLLTSICPYKATRAAVHTHHIQAASQGTGFIEASFGTNGRRGADGGGGMTFVRLLAARGFWTTRLTLGFGATRLTATDAGIP